ncbi:MAG: class A beta-lactamase-related serine hydrolase [Gemmatimonadota bacterium]|nr:class A beta-lactamase-related serine hydrolase [Gemmatimonadota bacterium]
MLSRLPATAWAVLSVALLAEPLASQIPSAEEALVLPSPDSSLQANLDRVLAREPYRSLVRRGSLSVSLLDMSSGEGLRYAAADDDHMRYAASLPKIAIMLAVFARIDDGALEYTPELKAKLEAMIRRSSNRVSSELITLVGFETIEEVLRDPHYELYDPDREGGLWVGKGYGGLGVWRRDPLSNLSHGATTRQVTRFLAMMELGQLVSPWASGEMKNILSNPAIEHKFVLGLRQARPQSRIFRKSGTWQRWHADAAVVERGGRKYVAVALLETERVGVLARLIVDLDDVIFGRLGTSP